MNEGIVIKYKDFNDKVSAQKNNMMLQDGIEAINDAKVLLEDLTVEVEAGQKALRGTNALIKYEAGVLKKKDPEKHYLENLANMYFGNKGFMKKALMKISGKEYPTLQESLDIVKSIAAKVQPHVENLSANLKEKRSGLLDLKGALRGNIEDTINMRGSLDYDIQMLEGKIKEIEGIYKTLEAQRLENSSNGNTTEIDLLQEIDILESTLGRAKDAYSDLYAKRKSLESNITITNGQIGKVAQLLESIDKSQEVVRDAKEFVDIQIPYILGEIDAQKAQIQAITGIGQVTAFIAEQSEMSKHVNNKIRIATQYLEKKVSDVRAEIEHNPTIYIEDKTPRYQTKLLRTIGSTQTKIALNN